MRLLRTIVAAASMLACGCLFSSTGNEPNSTTAPNNVSPNNVTSNNVAPNNITPNNTDACGNGELNRGETCDPCDDHVCPSGGCTLYVVVGSADDCNLACEVGSEVSTCADDDGCCPMGCDQNTDSDCSEECGNGELDPGETCDPCDPCPEDLPCSPVDASGDPSTCDVVCEQMPPPVACCGEDFCGVDEVCVDAVCEVLPPTGCEAVPEPNSYCEMQLPGSTCENNVCVPPTPLCSTSADCLPWQTCDPMGCIDPLRCVDAEMGRQRAWCAHDNFTAGQRLECVSMGNDTYVCISISSNDPPCMPSDCELWEQCDPDGDCIVPLDCSDARDGDTYCVVQSSNPNATCIGETCQ